MRTRFAVAAAVGVLAASVVVVAATTRSLVDGPAGPRLAVRDAQQTPGLIVRPVWA